MVAGPTGEAIGAAHAAGAAQVSAGSVQPSGPVAVVVRLSGDIAIELGDATPAWVAESIRELARPS